MLLFGRKTNTISGVSGVASLLFGSSPHNGFWVSFLRFLHLLASFLSCFLSSLLSSLRFLFSQWLLSQLFEIFAPLSFFLVLFPLLNHSPVASYYPIQLPGISPLPNRSVLLLSLFPTCSWSPLSFLLLLQSSCFLLFTGQWQKRLLSALASIASEFYFSHVSLPPFNLTFQQE